MCPSFSWATMEAPGDHDLRLVPAVAPRAGQQLLQGRPDVGFGRGQTRSVGRNPWKAKGG